MRRRLAAAAVAAVPLFGMAAAAGAQVPCDSYSGGCPTRGTDVDGRPRDRDADVGGAGRTLPFTGGELTLLTLVGAGAITGGAAFVTAGRRRHRAVTG